MEVRLTNRAAAPARLITCYEGEQPCTGDLPRPITQLIREMAEGEAFSPKFGTTLVLTPGQKEAPRHIVLMGLGKAEEFSAEKARKLAGRAFKEAKKLKAAGLDIDSAALNGKIDSLELGRALAEGAMLASYKFDKYITGHKDNPVEAVYILGEGNALSQGINEGLALAEATNLARILTDEPANIMTPAHLAREAEEAGAKYGFEVQVRDEAGIRALGMEAFLAVARASDNPPRLIVMRHMDDPDSKEILGLVGKGLTYDSGGLSLKPRQSMDGMKGDMAGAAAVIGAMAAIAQLKVKANVVGVVAACENMPSGKAFKVNDIVGSMAGKSIEVLNTDAEGRLTLADAVCYAVAAEKATRVLDIATLTGAAVVTFGKITTAVLANDDAFYAKLQKASELAGERIWRLPHDEEFKELIKSDLADVRNTSKDGAGTITAGLFVGAFVQGKPWLHLDIAGTSWLTGEGDYNPKGATGVGVRTMFHLARELNN
ncbi:MAG: leucyl aminopeptidase [Eubacteriales bacterium]|nr:leucyl aminopeptidase [Eubacteriales bacterium]